MKKLQLMNGVGFSVGQQFNTKIRAAWRNDGNTINMMIKMILVGTFGLS